MYLEGRSEHCSSSHWQREKRTMKTKTAFRAGSPPLARAIHVFVSAHVIRIMISRVHPQRSTCRMRIAHRQHFTGWCPHATMTTYLFSDKSPFSASLTSSNMTVQNVSASPIVNGDDTVASIPHEERNYQSYPGSSYVLPSDPADKER